MSPAPAPRALRLGLVLLALAALLSCGARRGGAPLTGLARVRAAGVLRWGGDIQGGEPYVSEDPAHPGHYRGFEVELADALAAELGVRAEFVQNDWTNLVPSLERGTFDVAMNGLEVLPSRQGRVRFTRPYFVYVLRLTARADDRRPMGLDDLRGRRIGSLANSHGWEVLLAHGATALPYDGADEPYIDLVAGRTDGVLLDNIIGDRYGTAERHPGLRTAAEPVEGTYAIAVRPSEPDLRDALDQALEHVQRSGRARCILARWNLDGPRESQWPACADASMRRAEQGPAHFGWGQVVLFLQGAVVTIVVSVGAMLLAVPLGLLLALARMYGGGAARWLASAYVEIFRGTPVLLQLSLLYFGLAPLLKLGPYTAAIVGLGLNYGAYEAEVYRAGIQAVPKGQMEAALSLGMVRSMALRRVIIPQAFRMALPGVTNDFIALLKDSSLVSVITVVELTKRMTISAVDTRGYVLPGLLCAALYFAMSWPLGRLAHRLEERLARS